MNTCVGPPRTMSPARWRKSKSSRERPSQPPTDHPTNDPDSPTSNSIIKWKKLPFFSPFSQQPSPSTAPLGPSPVKRTGKAGSIGGGGGSSVASAAAKSLSRMRNSHANLFAGTPPSDVPAKSIADTPSSLPGSPCPKDPLLSASNSHPAALPPRRTSLSYSEASDASTFRDASLDFRSSMSSSDDFELRSSTSEPRQQGRVSALYGDIMADVITEEDPEQEGKVLSSEAAASSSSSRASRMKVSSGTSKTVKVTERTSGEDSKEVDSSCNTTEATTTECARNMGNTDELALAASSTGDRSTEAEGNRAANQSADASSSALQQDDSAGSAPSEASDASSLGNGAGKRPSVYMGTPLSKRKLAISLPDADAMNGYDDVTSPVVITDSGASRSVCSTPQGAASRKVPLPIPRTASLCTVMAIASTTSQPLNCRGSQGGRGSDRLPGGPGTCPLAHAPTQRPTSANTSSESQQGGMRRHVPSHVRTQSGEAVGLPCPPGEAPRDMPANGGPGRDLPASSIQAGFSALVPLPPGSSCRHSQHSVPSSQLQVDLHPQVRHGPVRMAAGSPARSAANWGLIPRSHTVPEDEGDLPSPAKSWAGDALRDLSGDFHRTSRDLSGDFHRTSRDRSLPRDMEPSRMSAAAVSACTATTSTSSSTTITPTTTTIISRSRSSSTTTSSGHRGVAQADVTGAPAASNDHASEGGREDKEDKEDKEGGGNGGAAAPQSQGGRGDKGDKEDSDAASPQGWPLQARAVDLVLTASQVKRRPERDLAAAPAFASAMWGPQDWVRVIHAAEVGLSIGAKAGVPEDEIEATRQLLSQLLCKPSVNRPLPSKGPHRPSAPTAAAAATATATADAAAAAAATAEASPGVASPAQASEDCSPERPNLPGKLSSTDTDSDSNSDNTSSRSSGAGHEEEEEEEEEEEPVGERMRKHSQPRKILNPAALPAKKAQQQSLPSGVPLEGTSSLGSPVNAGTAGSQSGTVAASAATVPGAALACPRLQGLLASKHREPVGACSAASAEVGTGTATSGSHLVAQKELEERRAVVQTVAREEGHHVLQCSAMEVIPEGDEPGPSSPPAGAWRMRLMEAVVEGHELLAAEGSCNDSLSVCRFFLEKLLELTGSSMGFIASLQQDGEGSPYLKTHAITNIGWTPELRQWYDDNQSAGLVFNNMDSLFGAVVATEDVVVSNSPGQDERYGGVPAGHPVISSFMGVPLFEDHNFIGIFALANRESRNGTPMAYDVGQVEALEPLARVTARALAGVLRQSGGSQCQEDGDGSDMESIAYGLDFDLDLLA